MAYTPYDSAIPGADSYANADVLATNAYNKALTQVAMIDGAATNTAFNFPWFDVTPVRIS